MQGIRGGSFQIRLVQLPFSVVASKAQGGIVVLALFTKPSSLLARQDCRSRREAGSFSWLSEEDRRRQRESLFFEQQKHRTRPVPAALKEWKFTRALAFETTRPPATMTTMAVAAAHEGGRQLRRRKAAHISVSTTQVAAARALESTSKQQQNSRKKSGKSAVSASPIDDGLEPVHSRETHSSAGFDLEARLSYLDQVDELTSLTVVELRGLMKHFSKPTAGRKEELISEVRKWLADRQAISSRQTKVDVARLTREPSSDAESLEGALLKAESKSRQSEAISRRTELYVAGTDLRETVTEKIPVNKAPQTMPRKGSNSLPNGKASPGPKSPRGAAQRKKAHQNAQPESDADEVDESIMEEEATNAVKSQGARKGNKVEKKVEETVVQETSVKTTVTGGRKRKVQVSKSAQSKKERVTEEEGEPPAGKSAVGSKEPWNMLVHKKPQADWVAYNPDTMRPAPPPDGTKTMKLVSWNVNGLRAIMKGKDNKKVLEALLLTKLAQEEDFDVLCLQETKLQEKDVEQISEVLLSDYENRIWSCSTSKLGYSGTAVLSRVKPVSVTYGLGILDHDSEGRLITVEFDKFFLLTSYVPNAGEKLVRLTYRTQEWDPALSQYIKALEKQKPVILTGDLNCSNEEIDIHNPDGNRKSAGFTIEERDSFKGNFLNQGLVDTFRRQHGNAVGYTYWGYRTGARPKNQGWRLDYFLVSEGLADQVHDSYIRPDVLGSDHCPIGLILNL